MQTAFIYSDDFAKYNYGLRHQLKPFRLKLTYDLIKSYGRLSLPNVRVVEANTAEQDDLLLYHTKDLDSILRRMLLN